VGVNPAAVPRHTVYRSFTVYCNFKPQATRWLELPTGPAQPPPPTAWRGVATGTVKVLHPVVANPLSLGWACLPRESESNPAARVQQPAVDRSFTAPQPSTLLHDPLAISQFAVAAGVQNPQAVD